MMPQQKPGKSNQCVATPDEFMVAMRDRFGCFLHDLAADASNTKCTAFFDEEDNSLVQDWHKLYGNLWLNPPFGDIPKWAKKCADEWMLGANIFMLVPASVGTEWYNDFVHPNAYVFALRPRLTFVGSKDPYPKDLMVCWFSHYRIKGFDTWRWKD